MSQSNEPPDVAVVLVNYRTPELTSECLDSLGAASAGLDFEAIVIDNGSGDGSADEIERRNPEATVVRLSQNRGFAAGVNEGFANTLAPIVALLNPDTRLEPLSLARLVEHLRSQPEVGVAAPLLVHPDGSFQRSAHRRFPNLLTTFVSFCVPLGYLFLGLPWHPHELTEAEALRGGPVAHVTGAVLVIRRAAYEDAGPLDEGFFLYLEETEWQLRVQRAGWGVDLVPDARVMHVIQSCREEPDTLSPHYLPSLYRYMWLQGVSEGVIDATLSVAAAISCANFWAVGKLFPSRRAQASRRLQAYRGYLAFVREGRLARKGMR